MMGLTFIILQLSLAIQVPSAFRIPQICGQNTGQHGEDKVHKEANVIMP